MENIIAELENQYKLTQSELDTIVDFMETYGIEIVKNENGLYNIFDTEEDYDVLDEYTTLDIVVKKFYQSMFGYYYYDCVDVDFNNDLEYASYIIKALTDIMIIGRKVGILSSEHVSACNSMIQSISNDLVVA